jgi:murein DD-endopeptidase MepM/ murein hydrolase activator NlpD
MRQKNLPVWKDILTICALPVWQEKMTIGQGFNGPFTHKAYPELGIDDSYSLDFILDEGSKVYAAKAGVIHKVIVNNGEDTSYHGTDPELGREAAKHTNAIIIKHYDGTYSNYFHLQKEGAVVKVGDRVEERDHIGYSGNTGWSTQPHLHWSMYVETEECSRKTIKVRFKDYKKPLEDSEIRKIEAQP